LVTSIPFLFSSLAFYSALNYSSTLSEAESVNISRFFSA
jgi:hypothetical protein